MKEQHSLLDEFRSRDGWLLIVLDACRHDVFSEEVMTESDVYEAWSRGHTSAEWFQKEWSSTDATYVTPNPFADDICGDVRLVDETTTLLDTTVRRYDPETGFTDVRERVERAVLPETLTGVALDVESEKMVVHYMNPHTPFLYGGPYTYGDVEDHGASSVQENYRRDLRHAIVEGVAPLVNQTGYENVAITADHGELLGEDGLWGHEHPDHPLSHTVPWVEVDAAPMCIPRVS